MRTKNAGLILAMFLFTGSALAVTDRNVHQVLNLSNSGRLTLVTHNGSVTITTWNQPKIDIAARIEQGDSDYPEDVQNVDVRISGTGSSVRVETNYDAIPWRRIGWFAGNERTLPPVHYTISLPATASVEIEDHNAVVRLTGLQGDVRVSAHNGRIVVVDHAGSATINAHNAEVEVGFSRFARPSEIETHNGTIDVRLPRDARFNVNASGHHIGVDSDFPVVARQLSRDSYVGGVNGGGPELRISTHNGSLRLRRS